MLLFAGAEPFPVRRFTFCLGEQKVLAHLLERLEPATASLEEVEQFMHESIGTCLLEVAQVSSFFGVHFLIPRVGFFLSKQYTISSLLSRYVRREGFEPS